MTSEHIYCYLSGLYKNAKKERRKEDVVYLTHSTRKSWRIMANQGYVWKQNDQIKRQRLTSTELCFVVFACKTLLDMHYMVTTNPMYLSAAQLLDNT